MPQTDDERAIEFLGCYADDYGDFDNEAGQSIGIVEWCVEHGGDWPCEAAAELAKTFRQVRADECEKIASVTRSLDTTSGDLLAQMLVRRAEGHRSASASLSTVYALPPDEWPTTRDTDAQ